MNACGVHQNNPLDFINEGDNNIVPATGHKVC